VQHGFTSWFGATGFGDGLHGSSPLPILLDAPPSLAPDAAQPPLPGLDGLLPPSLLQGW